MTKDRRWRAWMFGAIVATLSIVIATLAWAFGGGTGQVAARSGACAVQLEHRHATEVSLKGSIAGVQSKIEVLRAQILEPETTSGALVKQLAVEEGYIASLKDQKARIAIEGASTSQGPYLLWLMMPLSLAMSGLLTRWALRRPDDIFTNRHQRFDRWFRWWILGALILAALLWITEIATNRSPDKTWFGWDSYCVSASAFVFAKLAITGTFISAAVPLALIYCLSRSSSRPPYASEGKDRITVERYLAFLERATLWGLGAVFTFTVLWLYFGTQHLTARAFERIYLLPIAGLFLPFGVVASMMWNAHAIRREYEAVCRALHAANPNAELPKDPTTQFLGDNALKMPATVGALIGFAWYALEKLHVLDIILPGS